jgi:hypothetical protein
MFMSIAAPIRSCVFAALVTAYGLGMPPLSYGQGTTLIHACVNSKGEIRIITPEGVCNARETRVTWPAQPAEPVIEGTFTAVVALCNDPADVATGGGFRTDQLLVNDMTYNVVTSASCKASGLCGGSAGEDGWIAIGNSNDIAAGAPTLTAYVVCAQP